MSRGTFDTGDDNPFASARTVRSMLLQLLFLIVFYVLGQLLHEIGPINRGLEAILSRFYETTPSPPRGVVKAPQVNPPAHAQARQAFLGNGGPVTIPQALDAVHKLLVLQESIESLSAEERARAQADRDKLAGDIFKARLQAYLSAAPAKRTAELDRQIR